MAALAGQYSGLRFDNQSRIFSSLDIAPAFHFQLRFMHLVVVGGTSKWNVPPPTFMDCVLNPLEHPGRRLSSSPRMPRIPASPKPIACAAVRLSIPKQAGKPPINHGLLHKAAARASPKIFGRGFRSLRQYKLLTLDLGRFQLCAPCNPSIIYLWTFRGVRICMGWSMDVTAESSERLCGPSSSARAPAGHADHHFVVRGPLTG